MQTCSTQFSLDDPAAVFYLDVLTRLDAADIPYLVGGAFAYSRYSGIDRHTKDFDLCLKPSNIGRALPLLEEAGYQTALLFPHWLGKVQCGEHFMDLIFASGNGVAEVDDVWFEHAVEDEVLGQRLRLCPPEEMIWSKAFIQERERFDGAEVMHLLRELGPRLDWPRLLVRFGDHWPVLYSHIVLFRFIYPDRRSCVPAWVVDELTARFNAQPSEGQHVCMGTLLSREQYLFDLQKLGYEDARLAPRGTMTRGEIENLDGRDR